MTARLPVTLALLAFAAAPVAAATKAPPTLALLPGVVEGAVQPYDAKPGETVAAIAASHGVHPIRIEKGSAKALKDGLQPGETLFIDQRRIRPAFDASRKGIVVDLPGAHLYLLDPGGAIQADYPIGVSNGESDWKAPIGPSKIVDLVVNPTWHIPAKIQAERARQGLAPKEKVAPGPKNPLGVRWIGFGDGTYGIHGTLDPTSIKKYASHGCVRLNNAHVVDLYKRVNKGMPVYVAYQPVQLAADARTVWLEAFPDFYHQGYDYRAAVRALAEKAGVADRLNMAAVEKAITAKDGLLVDVGQPLAPASPLVLTSPSPSAAAPSSPGASASPRP